MIHLCDFQSQYQCELLVVLSEVVYPQYADLKQVGLNCSRLSVSMMMMRESIEIPHVGSGSAERRSTNDEIRRARSGSLHPVSVAHSHGQLLLKSSRLREVLAKIVNERTVASSTLPLSIFKLQLMCRKQNAVVSWNG